MILMGLGIDEVLAELEHVLTVPDRSQVLFLKDIPQNALVLQIPTTGNNIAVGGDVQAGPGIGTQMVFRVFVLHVFV